MSLDTLWTQFQNAQLTICQLFKYKMPSELAFLSHSVAPQGLHPISGDHTFKNGCNIICISIIFFSFNNNCKYGRPFLNVLSAEPVFYLVHHQYLNFCLQNTMHLGKKKKKRHYVYVVITVLNEVSLLCTEFSIQCHVFFSF